MGRIPRAIAATLLSASITCSAARAQDCASPEEAEAFAIQAMRWHLIVIALQCGERDGYNIFLYRFGESLRQTSSSVTHYFARTSGEHGTSARDAWNTLMANGWSQHALRMGSQFCGEGQRLFWELADAEPDVAINAIAARIAAHIPESVPTQCHAAEISAAPSRP